jgi:hypothetical protein
MNVEKKGAALMDENRKANRRRVLKSARSNSIAPHNSCIVRNLSETGAALDIPYAVIVPHEFNLIIEGNEASRDCRVVWRKENRLGVEFGR